MQAPGRAYCTLQTLTLCIGFAISAFTAALPYQLGITFLAPDPGHSSTQVIHDRFAISPASTLRSMPGLCIGHSPACLCRLGACGRDHGYAYAYHLNPVTLHAGLHGACQRDHSRPKSQRSMQAWQGPLCNKPQLHLTTMTAHTHVYTASVTTTTRHALHALDYCTTASSGPRPLA